MNLNQLYDLRTAIILNPNKVVTKSVVIAILDSHLSALIPIDRQIQEQATKVLLQATQTLQTIPRVEHQTRHPPSREKVRKAYGQ